MMAHSNEVYYILKKQGFWPNRQNLERDILILFMTFLTVKEII